MSGEQREVEAQLRAGQRHICEPLILRRGRGREQDLGRRIGCADHQRAPGGVAQRVDARGRRPGGPAVEEHVRRLEPLGLVDREDPHRLEIGLRALDVTLVGLAGVVIDPAAQLRHQLVQIAARARNLCKQQLDQVPGVRDRSLTAAEHQRPLGESAVLDHAAEQRLVRAP